MYLSYQRELKRLQERHIFLQALSILTLSDSAVGFSPHRHLLSWLCHLIQLPFVPYKGGREPLFPWKINFLPADGYVNPKFDFLRFSLPRFTSSVHAERRDPGNNRNVCAFAPDMWLMQTASLGVVHFDTQGLVHLAAVYHDKAGFKGGFFPLWLMEIPWLQGPLLCDMSFMDAALESFILGWHIQICISTSNLFALKVAVSIL